MRKKYKFETVKKEAERAAELISNKLNVQAGVTEKNQVTFLMSIPVNAATSYNDALDKIHEQLENVKLSDIPMEIKIFGRGPAVNEYKFIVESANQLKVEGDEVKELIGDDEADLAVKLLTEKSGYSWSKTSGEKSYLDRSLIFYSSCCLIANPSIQIEDLFKEDNDRFFLRDQRVRQVKNQIEARGLNTLPIEISAEARGHDIVNLAVSPVDVITVLCSLDRQQVQENLLSYDKNSILFDNKNGTHLYMNMTPALLALFNELPVKSPVSQCGYQLYKIDANNVALSNGPGTAGIRITLQEGNEKVLVANNITADNSCPSFGDKKEQLTGMLQSLETILSDIVKEDKNTSNDNSTSLPLLV